MERNPEHSERGQNGSDAGAGVKDPRGERAFTRRKPLSGSLDRCREVAAFAQAKQETRDRKAKDRPDQRMSHRRQAPEPGDDRIASPASQPVDKTPSEYNAESIGDLKSEKDIAVLDVGETDRGFGARP